MSINEKYSYKDLSKMDLTNAVDLSGTIIGSKFYKENGMKNVFPSNLSGITFKKCNLDNCIIPKGNLLVDCTNKEIKPQNDLMDWIIENGNPIEPIQKELFELLGLNINPINIPSKKLNKSIIETKINEVAI